MNFPVYVHHGDLKGSHRDSIVTGSNAALGDQDLGYVRRHSPTVLELSPNEAANAAHDRRPDTVLTAQGFNRFADILIRPNAGENPWWFFLAFPDGQPRSSAR